MPHTFTISANIVDVLNREIFPGSVVVTDSRITEIIHTGGEYTNYILPGFIDAHVHVESSMLVPSEFARLAVVHGTVATVSDPHEIGNVLGIEGVRYMIENGAKVPFKFYFGAPSCVPATAFETAGAEITAEDIRELFEKDGLVYLSEMMNYPGVIFNDSMVMEKIKIAHELKRPVDGHAPGLMGDEAKKYVSAGISTDHECFTLDEARNKVSLGMKILIREGSAAKNYEALHPLIQECPEMVMFCSDDKHPNDLVVGHINQTAARSIAHGYDLFDVLHAACVNPVKHYSLNVGLLQMGDPADFIVVNNLTDFKVEQTYIDGNIASVSGKSLIIRTSAKTVNNFNANPKTPEDFALPEREGSFNIRVIEALEGQLITNELHVEPKIENGFIVSDAERDILKLAVVERYGNSKPAIGFIKNFGLIKGAIASCVAHDSHNIIAVGVSDEDLSRAVNAVINSKGGISVACDNWTEALPLPVAGIMSIEDGYIVAEKYSHVDSLAKQLGTKLHAPFMTLSFMALLVIPQLKLSDKGLFDGKSFNFVDIFV